MWRSRRPAALISASVALLGALGVSGCRDPERVTVYFLEGERLAAVERDVDSEQVPLEAIQALLAGPNHEERARGLTTEIPSGTVLLDISLRDHTAVVDLSSDLHRGGGSLSMRARLAQLVYTATEISGVERVRLVIEGEPAEFLGGEGVLTESPLGRERFEEFAPEAGEDAQ